MKIIGGSWTTGSLSTDCVTRLGYLTMIECLIITCYIIESEYLTTTEFLRTKCYLIKLECSTIIDYLANACYIITM